MIIALSYGLTLPILSNKYDESNGSVDSLIETLEEVIFSLPPKMAQKPCMINFTFTFKIYCILILYWSSIKPINRVPINANKHKKINNEMKVDEDFFEFIFFLYFVCISIIYVKKYIT